MGDDEAPFWRGGGFFPGILLGAAISLSGLAMYLLLTRPEPVVVAVREAPQQPPRPVVPPPALPPQPPSRVPGQILDPAKFDDSSCAKAFASGGDVPDDLLYACANSNRLGACHLTNSCPTCACQSYARSDLICKPEGCGKPLNGTGCVSSAYYGRGNPLFGCEGDQLAVGACMMRRLLADGLCTRQ